MTPARIASFLLLAAAASALGAIGCAPAVPTEAPDPAAEIAPEEIRAHVQFLADDLLEGRESGTRGMELAALYVASRFAEAGLEPAGDAGWIQRVPLRRAVLDSVASELTFAGLDVTVGADDWAPSPRFGSTDMELDAEAVFLGYGIHAPEIGRSDYEGVDVAGKVVVALWGAPGDLDADQAAHFASGKGRAAVEQGATGLLQLATPQLETLAPWPFLRQIAARPAMAWVGPDGGVAGASRELAGTAILSPGLSRALLATAGIGLDEAVEEPPAAAVPLPVRVRMRTVTAIEEIDGGNVVGLLRADPESDTGEVVAVTAHLDHDGTGPPRDGDAIYNGAVDNAAGVAALIEVAESLAAMEPLPRSVYFIATDAEEKGLLGAEYWAQNPPVAREALVATVNMDGNHMLFPTADIIALGAERSSLGPLAEAAAGAEGLVLSPDPMPEQGFFTRSDHYPFVRQGVPALFLIGGFASSDPAIDGGAVIEEWLTSTYHSPADDLSQALDWPSGAAYARVALRIVAAVARAEAAPTWNPGDFFGETFGPERVRRD